MNLIKLSYSYIRRRTTTTLLNVLLLGLGVATVVVLMLFGSQLEAKLTRDARNIDAVVGAKGSPMQLILSGVYHVDVPTGNIGLAEARGIREHRAIKSALPLALGDSYQGIRLVGTTHELMAHYEATPEAGRLWRRRGEITAGARAAEMAGLAIGDTLTSAHGLTEGGAPHESHTLRIVGILQSTGSVADRLLFTSVETIWALHSREEAPHHTEAPEDAVTTDSLFALPEGLGRDLTVLLLGYSSPLAAVVFPRYVNKRTNMLAASPAFETARLFAILGVGFDALRAFGAILMIVAALSVFVALYNALNDRRYDLAVMRTLGASRMRLVWHVLLEGVLLAAMGTAFGLVLGHGVTEALGVWLGETRQVALTGFAFLPQEGILIGIALLAGAAAAVLPAIQAYKTEIAGTLARG